MTEEKIQALLNGMTLPEKLGQMTQLTPDFFGIVPDLDLTGPLKDVALSQDDVNFMGSTLNGYGAKEVREMQDLHLANDRNKIPLLIMADVVQGFKTIFPTPHAMANSFNPEVPRKAAEVAARESSASGVQLTFAPMTDLVRDPRWGRVMESPGEDPYLCSVMTAAAVKGFQGDDFKAEGKIASCVKHFAGYGASEGGRDYNTVDISEGILHEYYLPAYRAAVDAGVAMVMTSFNLIDRVPATVNKKLFRTILRDMWGFKGVTISDYDAVNESILHGICKDGAEAAEMAIKAGNDIEMISTHYYRFAQQLIDEGRLDIKLIDEATKRILDLKNALGLFENPYKDASVERENELLLCEEHRKIARELASQCIVLLQNNNNVLPLKKGLKIGVAGPFASTCDTLGGWAMQKPTESLSLHTAICEKMGDANIKVAMSKPLGSCCEGIFDVEDEVEEAIKTLSDCDIVVVGVGESSADTGEAASKTILRMSPNQEKLIMELKKAGKKVVTVVFSGRPLEIKPILPYSDAVVQAWFLGTESGAAISDVLFGDYNPSARLTLSFPHTVGQIPVYYNHFNTGRPFVDKTSKDFYVSKYMDCPNEPLFCFGYGLSYSTFEYSNFTVAEGETITASIDVTNTSKVAGKETVQLYLRDVVASVVRPVKELKGFQQVLLQPDETQTVSFKITKEMLKFYNNALVFDYEPGDFDIMIGRNSDDVQTKRIFVK